MTMESNLASQFLMSREEMEKKNSWSLIIHSEKVIDLRMISVSGSYIVVSLLLWNPIL